VMRLEAAVIDDPTSGRISSQQLIPAGSPKTPGRDPGVARFRQVNMDRPNVHHDALEFPDGRIVLVTRLCEGHDRAAVAGLCAGHARSARANARLRRLN
jgi:hypothetical protein